jgi:hypothetical protein
MLIIRNEQLKALADQRVADFRRRLELHLRKIFPARVDALGPAGLAGMIEKGREKAARYGMKSEREITLILDLMLGLDADFEAKEPYRWITDTFGRPDLDTFEKLDAVFAELPKRHPGPPAGA